MGSWGARCRKAQSCKTLEVAVKRDQPARRGHGKGGQVSVGPEVVYEGGGAGQCTVGVVKLQRLRQPADDGQRQKLPVGDPGFVRAQRVGQRFGLRAQAQKAVGGNTAKGAAVHRGICPVMAGSQVVDVALVNQRQPDVDVGQVVHWPDGWPGVWPSTRWYCARSSSSRMA